ncbi:MAG: LacI family DNA-binding transcriptional regulator [Phototrophicales bacterium]|nr:LacI family DNA-binding transcriptional regulator [Phototrophicales bacterium]
MRVPTIKDVADRAQVGIGTVSRVLNNSTQVRAETRERVNRAIEELGFIPNPAARQLSGGKTSVIGVITPFFTQPSYVERLAGIQSSLYDSDYDLVLYSINSREHFHNRIQNLLTQRRTDGLILLTPPRIDTKNLPELDNMPIVVLDSPHMPHYPTLRIDDLAGGKLATEYLLSCGYDRIGFIGDRLDDPDFGSGATQYRFEGMQLALAAAGAPKNHRWYRFGGLGHNIARTHTYELLSMSDRPRAIFADSDIKAFDVMNVAQEMGLRVPEDVAIIGFDDIDASRYMMLTTVRQPLGDSGIQTVELLLDWLLNKNEPEKMMYLLPLTIIPRGTT